MTQECDKAFLQAVVDLEGAPRVPWNSPFKDKLVLKKFILSGTARL